MKVKNRDGASVEISYDEIKHRIARLCDGLTGVDIDTVVIHTVNGIYDGITTSELDEMSARVCAGMQSVHYSYDALAARISVSNAAKNVRRTLGTFGPLGHLPPPGKTGTGTGTGTGGGGGGGGTVVSFSAKVAFIDARLPRVYGRHFVEFVAKNAERLDGIVAYERDAGHTYFALRTMERSYLMQVDDVCVESPQDMWMRVAVAINMPTSFAEDGGEKGEDALLRIAECYDELSTGMFTHATPTLFNAGMAFQQCSSW